MALTILQPEEFAYPREGFTRKGKAVVTQNEHNPIQLPYGKVRAVRVSIPDTSFSISARLVYRGHSVVGFLKIEKGEWLFIPEADPIHCLHCEPDEGCRR